MSRCARHVGCRRSRRQGGSPSERCRRGRAARRRRRRSWPLVAGLAVNFAGVRGEGYAGEETPGRRVDGYLQRARDRLCLAGVRVDMDLRDRAGARPAVVREAGGRPVGAPRLARPDEEGVTVADDHGSRQVEPGVADRLHDVAGRGDRCATNAVEAECQFRERARRPFEPAGDPGASVDGGVPEFEIHQ